MKEFNLAGSSELRAEVIIWIQEIYIEHVYMNFYMYVRLTYRYCVAIVTESSQSR